MGDNGNGRQSNGGPNSLFDSLDVMAQAASSQQHYNQRHPQGTAQNQVDERVLWEMLQDHNSTGNPQSNPQSLYSSYGQPQQQAYANWNTSSFGGERGYQSAYFNQYQRMQRQQQMLGGDRNYSAEQQIQTPQRPYAQAPRNKHNEIEATPDTSIMSPSLNVDSTPLDQDVEPLEEEHDFKESFDEYRPKSSVPLDITAEEFAKQGVEAAISSRLPPYSLDPDEYQLLKAHITTLQVSTYLNIRNAIVRLWVRNPLVAVTREEAAGCAKEYRYLRLAIIAYEFLVRNGFINFGCIEVPPALAAPITNRRKTIIVIGAGVSGLGCARQLEGLCAHFGKNAEPPRIVVLEARNRLGGRIYSHPLRSEGEINLPAGCRSTADLGAQIITGFERGNPLAMLIRGQLALHVHSLRDSSILYDVDGCEVDQQKDSRAESLYNDILDRVSVFKEKAMPPKTAHGDRELIDFNKEPGDGGRLLSEIDEERFEPPDSSNGPFSASVDKMTGRAATATGSSSKIPASEQLSNFGYTLKPNAPEDINLQASSSDHSKATLGKTMDNVLSQLQDLAEIGSQDLRLVNWHYANLEYANAANVAKLSLGHWDQDDGNEFRGAHAMIIGGYTQLVRGLAMAPTRLDITYGSSVAKVQYQEEGEMPVKVECSDGRTIEADAVVCTLPLGVLKKESVAFSPTLPEWKSQAIERLGFGLLNKVVLVYKEAFWDSEKDMVGLLREPIGDDKDQASYEKNRGRLYMFWNCSIPAGRPTLMALMAGEAANQVEEQTDGDVIKEATERLSKMYDIQVPSPIESIVTRWRKDPYSGGTYSYVAPGATGEDYDLMAKPVSKSLFFAGEAACRTHPATVHGAYLSGLKAASFVFEELYGPLRVPTSLVAPRTKYGGVSTSTRKRKAAEMSHTIRARDLKDARVAREQEALEEALIEALGLRPQKPSRGGGNPFLIFQKEAWDQCKADCEEARRRVTRGADSKVGRNEIRAALGRMWRELPDEKKKPFIDQAERAKSANRGKAEDFKARLKTYDDQAEQFRQRYMLEHPSVPDEEEIRESRMAEMEQEQHKKMKREKQSSTIPGDDDDSELDPDFKI